MSIFDPFNTSAQTAAANSQIAGINAGYGQLSQLYGQGQGQLQSNYASGLQPFQQNYAQSQQGTQQLGNLLGLNGAAGNQSAQQTLTNMPGYQFAQQQGNAATNASAAASGQLASGNQQLALAKQNQGSNLARLRIRMLCKTCSHILVHRRVRPPVLAASIVASAINSTPAACNKAMLLLRHR